MTAACAICPSCCAPVTRLWSTILRSLRLACVGVASAAAPTAGLHFTDALRSRLIARGIILYKVTLHVGAGTFLPVKVADTAAHRVHSEQGSVAAETAAALNRLRQAGGRIVAVGSTSLPPLETANDEDRASRPFHRDTALFITPAAAARSRLRTAPSPDRRSCRSALRQP